MFNASLEAHGYSVVLFLVMICVNLLLLMRANDLFTFRKQMAYTTPLSAVFLASAIFTGIVLILSKHLSFDLSNIFMIIIAIIITILEVKRIKPLKYLKNVPQAVPLYRNYAQRLLLIELFMMLAMSLWMWI